MQGYLLVFHHFCEPLFRGDLLLLVFWLLELDFLVPKDVQELRHLLFHILVSLRPLYMAHFLWKMNMNKYFVNIYNFRKFTD